MGAAILLISAASPVVADSHAWTSFHFIKKHLLILPLCLVVMVGVSLLNLRNLRRFSLGLFFISLIFLIATLGWGTEIKGARRWLMLAGVSLQPAEFIKPALAVLCGWMLAENKKNPWLKGGRIAFGLYLIVLFFIPSTYSLCIGCFVWGF